MKSRALKKRLLVFVVIFSVNSARAQTPSCDRPYQRGHFVQLSNEDLRQDRHRAINKKELKEWDQKQGQAQAACNSFVSKHPNRAVSMEFSYAVKGFAAIRERCDSFCGTAEELMQLYEKENKN